MSRFRRDKLATRYGLKPRDMEFLNALVEFTREWRVVGSGAEARVVSNAAFPSQARLAKMMGCATNTVAAAAKACEAAGLVVRLGRGKAQMETATGVWTNSTNRYEITLLASEVCADAVAVAAVTESGNALALVRDTGEKVPAEVPAASAVAAVGTREARATEPQNLRVAPPKAGAECSDPSIPSKGSSSSRGGAAKEDEEAPLHLSDGRTVKSVKRNSTGNLGGFLSDGKRYGCDKATMDALRAGAAVEARQQQGGYLWLVEAAHGRSRDAEGLRERRTSDCRTRLLLRPDECRCEHDEESGCWLFYFEGTESPVGFTKDEQMARLFIHEGTALVADRQRGEQDGAWCAWRKASNRDANGEVARGKPSSVDGGSRRSHSCAG